MNHLGKQGEHCKMCEEIANEYWSESCKLQSWMINAEWGGGIELKWVNAINGRRWHRKLINMSFMPTDGIIIKL